MNSDAEDDEVLDRDQQALVGEQARVLREADEIELGSSFELVNEIRTVHSMQPR